MLPSAPFLTSRVARRIFGLFLVCALIPVAAQAWLSFETVTSQLETNARRAMHVAAKSTGMSLLGRLELASATLLLRLKQPSDQQNDSLAGTEPFTAVATYSLDAPPQLEHGNELPLNSLTPTQFDTVLRRGRMLTRTPAGSLVLLCSGAEAAPGLVVAGTLHAQRFWEPLTQSLDSAVQLLVLDDSGEILYTNVPEADALRAAARSAMEERAGFTWHSGSEQQIAQAWGLFLAGSYSAASWRIVVSQPSADVFAPLTAFRWILPTVVALTLLGVVIAASIAIRRRLQPVEQLVADSQRIALGNFSSRIEIRSGDEFEDVGVALDQMRVALSGLFHAKEQLIDETLETLSRAIDATSSWTAGHSHRVTFYALAIAERMKLPAEQMKVLRRGGLLHDIGKIGIPVEVLDKPGKLTAEEFDLIKQHPVIGARILEPISAYREELAIVRWHHERWDGKGYPDGLRGNEIPLLARITAVADVFDALVSDRPYRPGWNLERVETLFAEERDRQFQSALVDVFLAWLEQERRAGRSHTFRGQPSAVEQEVKP